jgi:hypothetical protein
MSKERNKNGLIFTANTHPSPNFIIDDGVLKMIKGNETLKVYWTIIRHTIGFQQDSIQLANSTIGDKTGLNKVNVIRTLQKLKEKYKLIHFESCKGGRTIKNIKILLPEKFYSKDNPNLDEARKLLEANGFKVEAPEDKSKQEKIKPVKSTGNEIKAWNDFILWANTHLSKEGKDQVSKLKISILDKDELMIEGYLSNMQKMMILKYFKEISTDGILINFKEGDK